MAGLKQSQKKKTAMKIGKLLVDMDLKQVTIGTFVFDISDSNKIHESSIRIEDEFGKNPDITIDVLYDFLKAIDVVHKSDTTLDMFRDLLNQ